MRGHGGENGSGKRKVATIAVLRQTYSLQEWNRSGVGRTQKYLSNLGMTVYACDLRPSPEYGECHFLAGFDRTQRRQGCDSFLVVNGKLPLKPGHNGLNQNKNTLTGQVQPIPGIQQSIVASFKVRMGF